MAIENDDQFVERLVPKILSSIRAKAKPVESIPVKADLNGITSLPAYDTTGGQHKTVLVEIEALRLPAVEAGEAAIEATAAANAAADRANDARSEIQTLGQVLADAESARVAAEKTRTANETARKNAETTRVSSENSRVSAENSRKSNESARVAAEASREKTFQSLKEESMAATESAVDTANHPTYVGDDNYVYQWNKETRTYNKTSVYVRGEAFSIKKVYSSISEMMADNTSVFKEGDFCLIDTGNVENPDNAKLYVRSSVGSWDFLVDMSGAIGFTGKVPQLFIGTVVVGKGKESASVSISPNGVDADGNPKYNLNYEIPCLAYEDLSPSQIEELQRPAMDMISKLQETDNLAATNEQARISAENKRLTAEAGRTENETDREAAESIRKSAESERRAAESARASSEDSRERSEQIRESNENSRKNEYAVLKQDMQSATENAEKLSEEIKNTPKIQDGKWWVWDVSGGKYKDTGVSATGRSPIISNGTWWIWDDFTGEYIDTKQSINTEYQLTKDKIESVFRGDIDTHTHTHLIYSAQVYDKKPVLSELTSWLGSDGVEHPFVAGNDIYVVDADEPTGYANYKLAVSVSGNVWVRIPQVPEGHRIVTVSEDSQ